MRLFIPQKLTKTKKCYRCTKRYPAKLEQCPHCQDIADGAELNRFIQAHRAQLRGNMTLGLFFLLAASLILVLMALLN